MLVHLWLQGRHLHLTSLNNSPGGCRHCLGRPSCCECCGDAGDDIKPHNVSHYWSIDVGHCPGHCANHRVGPLCISLVAIQKGTYFGHLSEMKSLRSCLSMTLTNWRLVAVCWETFCAVVAFSVRRDPKRNTSLLSDLISAPCGARQKSWLVLLQKSTASGAYAVTIVQRTSFNLALLQKTVRLTATIVLRYAACCQFALVLCCRALETCAFLCRRHASWS